MLTKYILFYSRGTNYGWLSNFERCPQIVDGITYKTNEHYYQSQKAKDHEIAEWIRKAPNPYLAMKAGRSLRKKEMKENWDEIKADVMLRGLRSKFQNPKLRNKLLSIGNYSLHENSPTDMYWGIKGKDMLGKLLMKVREEIRNEKD